MSALSSKSLYAPKGGGLIAQTLASWLLAFFSDLPSTWTIRSNRLSPAASAGDPGKTSSKKIHRLCREISDLTSRSSLRLPVAEQVTRLNRTLRGWWNYFSHGTVGRAYQVVNNHTEGRLRRWLCEKHKEPRPGYTRYPSRHLYQDLGLVRLRKLPRATGP